MTDASIVHVMIRVLDFERSKQFYAALGMMEIDRYEFADFRVCYLAQEMGPQIELIENIGRAHPYKQGEGFGNVAFVVTDLAVCHRALAATGAETRPITEIVYDGHLFARYFHTFDPDGYRVEVLEKTGRWASSRPDRLWLSKN
jgi:lactoylglutathione lyase